MVFCQECNTDSHQARGYTCDLCKKMFCTACVSSKITVTEVRALDLTKRYLTFYCNECKIFVQRAFSEDKTPKGGSDNFSACFDKLFNDKMEQLFNKMSDMQGEILALKNEKEDLSKMLTNYMAYHMFPQNSSSVPKPELNKSSLGSKVQQKRDAKSTAVSNNVTNKAPLNTDKNITLQPDKDITPRPDEPSDGKLTKQTVEGTDDADGQWRTVSGTKMGSRTKLAKSGTQNARVVTFGTAKMQDRASKIVGAVRRRWIYVGKIRGLDVAVEDVKHYMGDDAAGNLIEVKKLDCKGQNSAFSIGVPNDELYGKIFSPDYWPEGVCIREFNIKRNFLDRRTPRT